MWYTTFFLDPVRRHKWQDNPRTTTDTSLKWCNGMRKLYAVNLLLNGMVSLRKQRERPGLRLFSEEQHAAFQKLYEEVQHCRYLRVPSNKDGDAYTDRSVAWVFEKD